MTVQEILFIVAVVFFVLAVIFVGLAVFVFVAYNVPDVWADLSGKKKAEEVEGMRNARPGRDRRKGAPHVEANSGSLAKNSSGSLVGVRMVEAEPSGAAQEQEQKRKQHRVEAGKPKASSKREPVDDSSTTLLEDDSSATDVLEDDATATAILQDGEVVTTILKDVSTSKPAVDSRAAKGSVRKSKSKGAARKSKSEGAGKASLSQGGSKKGQADKSAQSSDGVSGGSAAKPTPKPKARAFEVTRKIVLTDSDHVVRVEQGKPVRVER